MKTFEEERLATEVQSDTDVCSLSAALPVYAILHTKPEAPTIGDNRLLCSRLARPDLPPQYCLLRYQQLALLFLSWQVSRAMHHKIADECQTPHTFKAATKRMLSRLLDMRRSLITNDTRPARGAAHCYGCSTRSALRGTYDQAS